MEPSTHRTYLVAIDVDNKSNGKTEKSIAVGQASRFFYMKGGYEFC